MPRTESLLFPRSWGLDTMEPNRDFTHLPLCVCVRVYAYVCSCAVWGVLSQGHGTTCVCAHLPGPSMWASYGTHVYS